MCYSSVLMYFTLCADTTVFAVRLELLTHSSLLLKGVNTAGLDMVDMINSLKEYTQGAD